MSLVKLFIDGAVVETSVDPVDQTVGEQNERNHRE